MIGELLVPELVTDYHADREYFSRGNLADFCLSRAFFHEQHIRGNRSREDNDNLRIGKGTHAIALRDTLEMRKIREIPARVLGAGGRRVGNRYTLWTKEKAQEGMTLMLPSQFRLCQSLAAALHGKIGNLIDHPEALREVEHRWRAELPFRLKADLVIPGGDEVICIDLKTARSVNPKAFWREFLDRMLWLQVAHYSLGLEDKFQKPVRFLFAAVRKTYPHLVRIFEPDAETCIAARRQHRAVVLELVKCRETGVWSEPDDDLINPLKASERQLAATWRGGNSADA